MQFYVPQTDLLVQPCLRKTDNSVLGNFLSLLLLALPLLLLIICRTPVRPGVSKVFYNMLLSTKMDPKQMQKLTRPPAWDLHAQMLRFFVSDL